MMKSKQRNTDRYHSKYSFAMITFMHDNPLLPLFRDPYKILNEAGLRWGQKVLEVGCGPGYFTIPAANIVGNEGIVYAVDVHPLAIKRVEAKIKAQDKENIFPLLGNASNTGLPEESIDLAFMIGLPYIVGGQERVLSEINRLLTPGGFLSYRKSRGREEKLITEVERSGLTYSEKQGKFFIFRK